MSVAKGLVTQNPIVIIPPNVSDVEKMYTSCQKATNLPAKCARCENSHFANYRGCPVHKKFQCRIR
jgi:hypothetical protein